VYCTLKHVSNTTFRKNPSVRERRKYRKGKANNINEEEEMR
jgi:hypothetical protein